MWKLAATIAAFIGIGIGIRAHAAPLALGEWQSPTVENGTLTMTQEGDLLAIRYTLLPYKPYLFGNRTRLINEVDLLLQKPIVLDPTTERIAFESKGLVADGKSVQNARVLWPIVRDEEGELFFFQPRDTSNLSGLASGWNAYSTGGFFTGEAGAASISLYTTGGVPGNSRPDGKLELLGFRMHVTQAMSAGDLEAGKKTDKPVEGVLYLGETAAKPFQLSNSEPFAYADGFLKEAGDYRFAVQVTNEFQGTPIREFQQAIHFDPKDAASCRQRLSFPLGPDGIYWINYQVTRADGAAVAGDSMQYQVLGNTDTTPPTAVDLTQAPAIGYMRISPGDTRRGVYAAGEPMDVTVKLFPKGKQGLTLRHVLTPYFTKDVLGKGEQPITAAADGAQDVTLKFFDQPPYTAYRLVLELVEAGKVIDQRTWLFGRRTDASEEHPRAGLLTDRREIKKLPYNRFTYTRTDGNRSGGSTREALVADFRDYLKNTSGFIQHHTYMIELNDFEVLPGVFDFSMLDAVMDLAAEYAGKITVRFAHSDQHGGSYRWGKYSRQISAEGTVIDMAPYGAYATTDPALGQLWNDAYRALYNRYRNHTAFEGYYIMKPGGEWTVVDQPWAGSVAGYSPITAQGFRDYLQQTLGLSLEALNARWGTQYASFDAIQSPMPTFRDGAVPDLRVEWLDFCRFKADLNSAFWVPQAINAIRAFDDDRITIVYGYPSEFPTLLGKLDYGHNGGNHRLDHLGEFERAWLEGGIGWITEPIHPHGWAAQNDPGRDGWVLDVSVWTMLSQAGGGGANLHVYYYKKTTHELVAHQGGFYALDRMERLKPVLRELQQARLVRQVSEIAVNQDDETLYAKHRTTFHSRLSDLRRWFQLLEDDGVPYAEMKAFPDQHFKLIMPNILDEVVSKASFDRYVSSVRDGGSRMMISANTGKYVPELGREPFQLLKAFGIAAPTQPYITNGTVKAEATVDHALFTKGATIPFQTVSHIKEQMASDEVIANFWQYPYRWIPETDYFGYYPGQQPGGTVLARFADGGAAVSVHQVGKGEVVVFWGTPDMSEHQLDGLMKRAVTWAGVHNPMAEAEVPYFTEMTNADKKRHYGLAYHEEKYGTFRVTFPNCPDGDFYCDEMIADTKIGRISGKDLREKGLKLQWRKGDSPLKIVRAIPAVEATKQWVDVYIPE